MPGRDPLTLGQVGLDSGSVRICGPDPGAPGPRPGCLVLRCATAPDGRPWPPWIRPGTAVPLRIALAPPARLAADEIVVAEVVQGGRRLPAVTVAAGRWRFFFDPRATLRHMTAEHDLHERLRARRPLFTLPLAYRLAGRLPGPLRLAGHGLAVRAERLRQGSADPGLPRFPVDLAAELVRHLAQRALGLTIGSPWPDGRPALVLTHDVDTARGQRAILRIARLEERLGLRSGWFVVGRRFPLDHGLLGRLRQAGHEIGLHGVLHDGRLPFLPPREAGRRLDSCMDLVKRHEIEGFRAPALLLSEALAREVGRRFLYDSSVPDTDTETLAGSRRGCSTVFPFFRQGLVELPLTMPLEDRLLLLGYTPAAMIRLWQQKLAWIHQVGGLALCTTHAEPHLGGSRRLLLAYGQLLELVVQKQQWTVMLPRQVARWWRDEMLEPDHAD